MPKTLNVAKMAKFCPNLDTLTIAGQLKIVLPDVADVFKV